MMMVRLILAVCGLILINSCKKEKDETPPSVIITEPTSFQTININEGVLVKASVNDNEKIESISIYLVNLSTNRSVGGAKIINPNSSTYQVNEIYIPNDSLVESGRYRLTVEAFDGENKAFDNVELPLQGLQQKPLSILVACGNSTNTTVYELDGSNNQNPIITTTKDIKTLKINSDDQHLWIIPNVSREVEVYHLNESRTVFQKNYFDNGLSDLFQELILDERTAFLSLKSGELRRINNNFSDNLIYTSPSPYYAERVFPQEKRIVISENYLNGTSLSRSLISLFNFSWGVESTTRIGNPPLAILEQTENQNANTALLAYGGQSLKSFLYNPENGTLNTVRNINIQSYDESFQITDDDWVLINQRSVGIHSFVTNVPTTFKNNLNDPAVAFDEVNSHLIIGNGSSLNFYSYNSGALIWTVNFPEKIKAVAVRYNRN